MQVLAAGVRAANTFEGRAVGRTVREFGTETLLGPMRFSAIGDWVDSRIWIYRVEEGELRQLDRVVCDVRASTYFSAGIDFLRFI